ncbi:MAG: hypothetical protein ACR2N9_00840, partial [Acidimicrobiia bacterium]
MSKPRVRDDKTASASRRRPLMLQVSHWELLIVCVLLLAVFAMRQTGALPGQTIRLLDVFFVAVALELTMHRAMVGRRARALLRAITAASIVLALIGVTTSSVTMQRIASSVTASVLAALLVLVLLVVLRQRHVTADTLFGALAA